jgi:hypothetical protein
MIKMSRRTMLISGSTALMLPILESNVAAFGKLAASAPPIPKRLVFLPMGYGVNQANWFPSTQQEGTEYDLPPLLESFQDLKSDFSIIQNLSNRHKAGPHGGSTNWLTCGKTKGNHSVSCDQVAAEVLGRETRHSSLALAGGSSRVDGHGGYVSWGDDGKPVGLHRKMSSVYTNLFGSGIKTEEMQAKLSLEQSSLDAILGNAKRLNNQISSSDRQRVDEYFTSIRNIEKRLVKAQAWLNSPLPKAPYPKPSKLTGKEEIEVMLDMMRIAMQSDSTRVMTYMLPTQNILREIRTRLNPHRMSHQANGDIHQERDRMLAELVSDFVRKLKETKEADGSSLLDHSLVAYGSAIRSGHTQANGPTLLAGHGGGGLKQGQNIVFKKNTPLSNLWLSVLRHVGVNTEQFADSQRVITEMGFE